MIRYATPILVLVLLVTAGCAPGTRTPERVIIVAVDSLRADHLGYMGYEKPLTPWLDSLAADSAVFTRAFAPSNVTVPSVPALFTGKPYSHLFENPVGNLLIPEEEVTMAELFSENGFATFSWSANPYVCSPGFGQGFDLAICGAPQGRPTMTLDEMIGLVRRSYQPTGGPEFHYIHTMDVHHPYDAPMPYDTMFLENGRRHEDVDAVTYGNLVDFDGRPVWSWHPFWAQNNAVDEHDVQYAHGLYEGTIRYTDARLPDLLAALNYDPKQDWLIVTADHGEQFFEHGGWRHGRSLTPEETHVPLLMRFDGFAAARFEQPVSWLDLFPTFAEIFGWTPPKGLTGESLAGALRGQAFEHGPVYVEGDASLAAASALVDGDTYYLLETERWRMEPDRMWPYSERLSNLSTDPLALVDQAAEHPEKAEAANTALRQRHPRWEPFARDAIRTRDVPLGENVLDASLARNPSSTSAWPRELTGTSLRIEGTVTEAGLPHWLVIPFRLERGQVHMFLESASGEVFWRYTASRTDADSFFELSCRVAPAVEDIVLRIEIDGGGQVFLRSPSLRPMTVPALAPVAVGAAHAVNSGQTELSPEERERLESLGYAQ